ncbi:hypothetical protein CBER1_10914 [Cercospora berteroae]|uniref:Tat pathway signal sequence n=1 Tax=Cercospora berteroae TaxID=357750 RepID=A0A2S6BY33_9PEZI|nr:hypothetical protein CBER1_10914 [Cercospora berteroae]
MGVPTMHQHKYRRLSESTSLVNEDVTEQQATQFRRSRFPWSCTLTTLLAVIATFFATRLYEQRFAGRPLIEGLAAVDAYSPLYDGFRPRIEYTTLGGDLWGNKTNIWRQGPSPVVEEAWDSISESRYLLLTKEELAKMGRPLESAVQWPDDPNKYLMEYHAYHVFHCLNEMRKNAYVNFDYYFGGGRPLNAIHWDHFTHCLDILRQELTCLPSMQATRMVWQEGQSTPFPEFRTHRMCMRWDDFEEWTAAKEIPREAVRQMTMTTPKPVDVVERPASVEAWEVLHRNSEWIKKMKAAGHKLHWG